MKLKTKLAICAWTFNLAVVIAGYNVLKPVETGYTAEQRSSMDSLFDGGDLASNVRALSVADIGLDAEKFMDGVQ